VSLHSVDMVNPITFKLQNFVQYMLKNFLYSNKEREEYFTNQIYEILTITQNTFQCLLSLEYTF
jgi:recombinational DNA repair protein (RecF pathway)